MTLEEVIRGVLNAHKSEVDKFKKTERRTVNFLMGQLMRATNGAADPEVSRRLIRNALWQEESN